MIGVLSLGWKVVVPLNCGVCPVLVGPVACESLLIVGVGRTHAYILLDAWVWPLLKAVLCPVVCFGVSMGLVWLWPACMLMCRVVLLFS